MDNSKSIKFNFNKMLLKATALVVIGAFLLNMAFVDLARAYSRRERTESSFLLRATAAKEDPKILEKILESIPHSSPKGSPANFFRILTRDENIGREISIAELRQETGLSADTIERDMRLLKEAGLVIRGKSEGKITFKIDPKLDSSGERKKMA